jgi:hypothetical protein
MRYNSIVRTLFPKQQPLEVRLEKNIQKRNDGARSNGSHSCETISALYKETD